MNPVAAIVAARGNVQRRRVPTPPSELNLPDRSKISHGGTVMKKITMITIACAAMLLVASLVLVASNRNGIIVTQDGRQGPWIKTFYKVQVGVA